jgi:uncharacterized membrane protein YphA (DoxX/SURF4 family)
MTPATVLMRWEKFWFPTRTPYRMAGFRILLGLYLLAYFGTLAPHVTLLFSSQGVYIPFLVPDYAPAPVGAWIVYAVTLLLALAVTVGFRTRFTAPMLLAAFLYHYFLGIAVAYSVFDRMIIIYLLVLTFSDGGRVWAVDPADSDAPHPACGWGERILTLQAFMLYFGSGLWKAMNPAWYDGELLEAVFQSMWATQLGFWIARLELGPQVWTLVSWTVIVVELLVGLGFLFPRIRWWAMVAAAIFHLGNALFLGLPEFLVCICIAPIFASDRLLWTVAAQFARLRHRVLRPPADAV